MTYIKWKDEVEGYLGNLSADEKQKILSYFAEMYADKRDAGKSEAQIIEEFGAPYDVAKRILEGSKDNAPQQPQYRQPQYQPPQQHYQQPQYQQPPLQNEPRGGAPDTQFTPTATKRKGAGHAVASVVLVILLAVFSVFFISAPIIAIAEGFAMIGATLGALVSGNATTGLGLANIGYGLACVGAGFLILAPFSVLLKLLWKKLKEFI